MRQFAYRTAAVLALISAGQAQAATASNCITRPEMQGLVAYFLPPVLGSAITSCEATLPAQSYLITKGPALVDQLATGKDAAWPAAKTAFIKMSGKGKDSGLLERLPDEALRPLIEGIIETELLPSIKPGTCEDINRVAATLEPLPTANTVSMVAELLNIAARKDGKFASCPVQRG